MISIIICSRNNIISEEQKKNIYDSIKLNYELIIIDNSKNQYSISEAYNEGIKRSQYPFLCFIHEDVLFHTTGWGVLLMNHFSDPSIGIIGIAGTHFLPSVATYWSTSPFITTTNIQNIDGKQMLAGYDDFFQNKLLIDAVACDGMCLFMRKNLYPKISFDEKTFSGFDFYDMDICMQVLTYGYKVCICKDIIVEHFSMGNYHSKFYETQDVFFDKWKNYFPISRGISMIPTYVIVRTNNLYLNLNQKTLDVKQARNSKAYKIGKIVLKPFKHILKREK